MAKVVLDVSDKDLNVVKTILENLKSGIIKSMSIDSDNKNIKPVPNGTSKYLSKEAYKQKLKKPSM